MEVLQGRTALITGAGRGIGAGIAMDMARAGARVAVNDTTGSEDADDVVQQITNGGGTAHAFRADVSQEGDVTRLFAEVNAVYGTVDLVVNNAGVWNFQPLLQVTVEEYRRHYDVNVLGNVLVSREFARQEDADGGAIINLTSIAIASAGPATSLYTGTKMAIVGMTRVLAMELAPRRIRVNSIAADLIDTGGTRASGFVGSRAADEFITTIPLGRIGVPEDVAPLATFLASDAAQYITGEVIFAAGGLQLP